MQDEKGNQHCTEPQVLITSLSFQVQNMCANIHFNCNTGESSTDHGSRCQGVEDGLGALKRIVRFEFLEFSGDYFDGWLYKVNQFFEFDSTLDELKIKLTPTEAVVSQFIKEGYEDPMGKL